MPKPVSRKRAAEEAPSTPSQCSVPSTPTQESEVPEPKKPKKQRKGAEEQVPLTPVQKAKDMCAKLLKKKNDASNLTLTLQSLPYAQALSAEMQTFATQFESFGCFCFLLQRIPTVLKFQFPLQSYMLMCEF